MAMTKPLEAHAAHFCKQAEWCDRLGSPFNAALLWGLADELGDGGPLDALLMAGDSPLMPEAADAGPLRVAGALHGLVLTGRDPALVAVYPGTNPDWDMASVLPVVRAAFETHSGWVADFLTRPPQTNETRRSIALLPGFSRIAGHGPLHLLEVGASAGLNLNWDAFGYDGGSWSRAGHRAGPTMTTHWSGPPPQLPPSFDVVSRRGCDCDPVDISDPGARLRLKAYIWPDQPDRMSRLDAALAMADRFPVTVDRADAAPWLEDQLAGPLSEGTTVIYHSIAWQYFDADTHARAKAAIETTGARADDRHRLAWLRFEPARVFDPVDRSAKTRVDLITWPGGTRQLIADADPHGAHVAAIS